MSPSASDEVHAIRVCSRVFVSEVGQEGALALELAGAARALELLVLGVGELVVFVAGVRQKIQTEYRILRKTPV